MNEGDRTRALAAITAIAPFPSTAVTSIRYVPRVSEGPYIDSNRCHAGGADGSVPMRVIGAKLTTVAPAGSLRVHHVPAISVSPKGSATVTRTTSRSMGVHTLDGPRSSRSSIESKATYVVVTNPSQDGESVEFVARTASAALLPMFRTVRRIWLPVGNVWSIPGNTKVKGW